MNFKNYAYLTLAAFAAIALMVAGAPQQVQANEHAPAAKELPSNAIGLINGDTIVFHHDQGGLSPDERVRHFWLSLQEAYGTHFKEYDDREIRKDDINLTWDRDDRVYRIKFHKRNLVEIGSADARTRERTMRKLAEDWVRLIRRHIVETQPGNSPDVMF